MPQEFELNIFFSRTVSGGAQILGVFFVINCNYINSGLANISYSFGTGAKF